MQAWQGTPATRIPEGAFPSMGPDVASPGKGQEDSAGAVGLEVEASPRHFPSDSQDLAATDLHMQAPFPLGYGHTQNRRQLLAKCFAFWSARTVQNLKAEQHRKRALLSGAFTSWSAAADRFSTWRMTLAWLERARGQRLLASCFGRWKAEFQRAERRRKGERPRRRLAGYGAMWRWRKAIRGSWALRFSSVSQISGPTEQASVQYT
uniref:uncharacterized protein LOC114589793 n=1 Tax=Podarcis muralis TaxID=64176 RepID=UPI00109F7788|nr:uncharacterized protein LOC114589793 [Podarcis muralis]XP_028572324.1 uncharacterized protein LOC114590139 [Podarcis muralis]XP_028572325.1 uncharacterized protein LOC114590139 [Podarcis muralis]XP_028572326.1 uncharacterized protein LOC114590139 [Podarcis muralis]XP_028572380.1 uncharacterized protein LOC114590216 isoform X2 [Podarcis muralis]XP_028572381.1 uncharacterized protein LOC114590216 isoform X2 [Podarcis muralis]XP_028572382.1 uncharacterized protein LOC114590216 isoform X2 [Pod